MVNIRENAIRLEVGFSYQWIIDYRNRVAELCSEGKAKVTGMVSRCIAGIGTCRDWAVNRAQAGKAAVVSGYVTVKQCPSRVKNWVVASMLGIPVESIATLRDLVMNPPTAAPAVRTSRTSRAASAVETPAIGVNVDAAILRDAVTRVGKCVSSRSSLPILTHILVRTEGNSLVLSSTDLEVSAEVRIDAAVNELKPFAVPYKQLAKALKGAKGTVNLIEVDEANNIHIGIGAKRLALNTLPAEEYPTLPAVTSEWQSVAGLTSAISDVIGA